MSDHLLVTADTNAEKQKIIRSRLQNDEITIKFLAPANDNDRSQLLQQADLLLSFVPQRELHDNEFNQLQNARFMQLTSAGADHIPYRNIPVDITIASNTGAYAKPMAEHVLAMSLTLAKRLREEHHHMKNGEFNQYSNPNLALYNATIGFLGFGGTGKAAARLFRAFGSRIFAMNTSGESSEPADFIGTIDDLRMILESSDTVVLSLPLNNHTRRLIGKKQLEWMKSDGILINVARGGIINQKELYEHLKKYSNFKAGLESWWVEPVRHGSFELDYPFLDLPNVLASPHNSSVVEGIMEHGIDEAAKNIQRYVRGESFKGKVCREDYI
jgi:glycerate dehydrogenase